MQSETIGALAAALAKAQGEMKPAAMDKTAKITQTAGYKYATLARLWESARDALSINGLAVVQTTDIADNGDLVLISTLMHSSGEWVGSVYPVRAKDGTPQALGSALTYARRYALGALVGLTSDDDDDGNAAQGAGSAQAQPRKDTPQHRTPPAAQNGTATGNSPANGGGAGNGSAMSPAMKAFHKAGTSLYGDGWETKRHEIVKAYTKGRTTSSKELTPAELSFLLDGLSKRLEEQLSAAVQDAPEFNPDALTVPA